MTRVKKFLRFLLPILWMALIFYGSSRQKVAVSGNYLISFIFFKTLHIIEYGLLFLLWRFALYKKNYGIWISIVITILYGISDEIHQTLVPTREGRIRDVLIDTLGVLIFWQFISLKVEKFFKKNKFLKSFYSLQ